VLAEPGKQYAIFLERGKSPEFTLAIPKGKYVAVWINTMTGIKEGTEGIISNGGRTTLKYEGKFEDIALSIRIK
jgi:hypothetical protein